MSAFEVKDDIRFLVVNLRRKICKVNFNYLSIHSFYATKRRSKKIIAKEICSLVLLMPDLHFTASFIQDIFT